MFKDWRGQGLFSDGECGFEEAVSKEGGKNDKYMTKSLLSLTNMFLNHNS